MTIAAIVLAGGESSRMGEAKPLLEWGGSTLIEYQLAQLWTPPIDATVVVLGHRAQEVLPYVRGAGIRPLINEGYRQGRASSLRLAAEALPEDTQAVVVLNVDQPRPRAVIAALLEAHLAQGSSPSPPTGGSEATRPSSPASSCRSCGRYQTRPWACGRWCGATPAKWRRWPSIRR